MNYDEYLARTEELHVSESDRPSGLVVWILLALVLAVALLVLALV